MILECLKTGPRSERDIKDFVTEKCKKCGIKATNRGTIAGANLEISSACNILGAMGILEQAHVDDRVEPDLFINPALPDPPSDEGKVEDYLSLLAYRWSKIIESVVTESQTMEIASSASINQDKASVTATVTATATPTTATATASNTLIPPVKAELLQQLPPPPSHHLNEVTSAPSQHSHDDMDFVDILMQSSDHLDLPSHHQDNFPHSLYPNHSSQPPHSLPLPQHPFAPTDYSNTFLPQNPTIPNPSHLSGDVNVRGGLNLSDYNDPNHPTALIAQDLSKSNLTLTAGKPSGMTRKSASSTKIWRIKRQLARNRITGNSGNTANTKDKTESDVTANDDEVTRFLFTPDALLEKWGENSFRHHASLEVEEKLLRRLASQCSLGFRSKEVTLTPSHVGTRYLDNHYDVSNSEIVPTISLVQPPPTTTAPSSSSKSAKSSQRAKARQTQQPSQGDKEVMSGEKGMGMAGAGDFLDASLLSISTHPSSDSLDGLNDSTSQTQGNGNGGSLTSSKNREYDFTANVTANMLVDKVRKSKRHRGNSLVSLVSYTSSNTSSTSSGVNQVTSVALNNLKNICQASVQGYWGSERAKAMTSSYNNNKTTSSSSSSLTTPVTSNTSEIGIEEKEKSGVTSVAEYVRTCQQQNILLTNQFLNSNLFHAQAQQLLVNGSQPNLNVNLFRHYVTPLSVLDYDKITTTTTSNTTSNTSSNNTSIGAPICYPDVMITTLEIPWKSIVSEFQVMRSEEVYTAEAGLGSGSEVHRSYSYSDITPPPNPNHTSQPQPLPATATLPPSSSSKSSSKQKTSDRMHRSASFDSSSVQLLPNHHNTSLPLPSSTPLVTSTILRCRSVSEVIAPAFREINNNADVIDNNNNMTQTSYGYGDDVGIAIDRSMSVSPPLPPPPSDVTANTPVKGSDDVDEVGNDVREGFDSEEEDTSDEAYLSKHDHVLRTMREKWALMQQLKLETRRETMQGQGSAGGSGNGSGNTTNTAHHKRSYSFQSPFKASQSKLGHSQSNEHLLALHQNSNHSNNEEEEGGGGLGIVTEGGGGGGSNVSPMTQSEGSPLDGTTSLLGGLISYNSRKRSYSLLNISKIGEVVNGTTSASATSSVGGVEGGSGGIVGAPVTVVKKRGRPPKIQKTSHLHYGKINS